MTREPSAEADTSLTWCGKTSSTTTVNGPVGVGSVNRPPNPSPLRSATTNSFSLGTAAWAGAAGGTVRAVATSASPAAEANARNEYLIELPLGRRASSRVRRNYGIGAVLVATAPPQAGAGTRGSGRIGCRPPYLIEERDRDAHRHP